MIEARTETATEEIKRVKIEKFDPKEAEKFLPGWDCSVTESQIAFTRTIKGVQWTLSILHSLSTESFVHLDRREGEVAFIGGVNEVEFNYQSLRLSFISKRGRYDIFRNGLSHRVSTSRNDLGASIWWLDR